MRFVFGLTLLASACASPASPSPNLVKVPTTVATAATPIASATKEPWIEDDFDRALALAKTTHRPLFIDAWATWCHTCRSMRSYVLSDPTIPRERFVWLSIDQEKNATAVSTFPAKVLPTFFVVDPSDSSVTGRWEGAASIAQIRSFLADNERYVQSAHDGNLAPNDPLRFLQLGDRAALARRWPDAARAYGDAIERAPIPWARKPDALVARINAFRQALDNGACVDLALVSLAETGSSSSVTDFSETALECASDLPKNDARVATLRERVLARLTGLVKDNAASLTPDDRGDAWRLIGDVNQQMGLPAAVKAAAVERLRILEEAAIKAPDLWTASTYDGGRLEALLTLGRATDAVTFLQKRETDLPGDYNVAHRLAKAYLEAGRAEDALKAIDRALPQAYGPRKGLVFALRADILLALGKKADAVKTVEDQILFYQSLPESQKKPAYEKSAMNRLLRMKTGGDGHR